MIDTSWAVWIKMNFISFNSAIKIVLTTAYNKTPDLVLGPNLGNYLDFCIDVNAIDGKMLKNKKGPLSKLVSHLEKMMAELKQRPRGEVLRVDISPHGHAVVDWLHKLITTKEDLIVPSF